jgi:hypothetical protein
MNMPRRGLAARGPAADDRGVEAPPLIYRREVVAMLFAVADLNSNVERILQLLEEEPGGEEGLPQEDA